MYKYFLLILIPLFTFSCQEESKTTDTQPIESLNFDWLIGDWQRTNDKAENATYESWKPSGSEEYIGLGCTIQKGDTVFKENLRIAKVNGVWNLIVSGVNETPTLFLMTKRVKNGFTAENEVNEFPKKIEYGYDGKNLHAKVSAGEAEIPFSFEKLTHPK